MSCRNSYVTLLPLTACMVGGIENFEAKTK
jgi:hypothetical protein